MGVQLKITPNGDIIEDKEIVVQDEVHNAREYMEQFLANNSKSLGINSQHNIFFPSTKKVAQVIYKLIYGLVFVLFVAIIIKGCISTPKNEVPTMTILGFFGLCFFYMICEQLKNYFRRRSCATQTNAIIVGKHFRIKRGTNNHTKHMLNTVFLVEYNTKVYVLCERNDGTEYGEVGDTIPVFIQAENPFIFYTEQYKKSCLKDFWHWLGMLCLVGIFIFWCWSSIK